MALSTYFESVSGDKFVVRTQDIKWAYPKGSTYFIEWYSPINGTLQTAEIDATEYENLYDSYGLVLVEAKQFGDAPASGFIAVNPNILTIANNVGGQEDFNGGLTFDDWSVGGSGDYGSWEDVGEGITIEGIAAPADNATGLARLVIPVVSGRAYSLRIPIESVDFDGLTIGTDFTIDFKIGTTTVAGTALNVVEGGTITANFTAGSTTNVNVDILFTVLEEEDMSGLSISFGKPLVLGATTSTQFLGAITGTLVRYEIGNTPLKLLLADSVATLTSKMQNELTSYVPTGVNGTPWTGGSPALSSKMKINEVNEIGSDRYITLDAQASKLIIKTSTAITSLV